MTEPTTATRRRLPLASTGCSCCAPATPGTTQAPEPQGTAAAATAATARTYQVEDMTCGHCAGRVIDALTALDDVTDVRVDLAPGSTSAVVVTGSADPQSVRAAIEQAGYTLSES